MIKGSIQEDIAIVMSRAEINEIEMKKTLAKINEIKAGSLRR